MNVKLIRMSSGEDVLTEVIREDDDSIVVMNPVIIVPAGQGQIGFAPWSPLLDKEMDELAVSRRFIVWETVPSAKIIDEYKKMFSNLVLPDSGLTY